MVFRISRYYPRHGKRIDLSPTTAIIANMSTKQVHDLDFMEAEVMIHAFEVKATLQYTKFGLWRHYAIIGISPTMTHPFDHEGTKIAKEKTLDCYTGLGDPS